MNTMNNNLPTIEQLDAWFDVMNKFYNVDIRSIVAKAERNLPRRKDLLDKAKIVIKYRRADLIREISYHPGTYLGVNDHAICYDRDEYFYPVAMEGNTFQLRYKNKEIDIIVCSIGFDKRNKDFTLDDIVDEMYKAIKKGVKKCKKDDAYADMPVTGLNVLQNSNKKQPYAEFIYRDGCDVPFINHVFPED